MLKLLFVQVSEIVKNDHNEGRNNAILSTSYVAAKGLLHRIPAKKNRQTLHPPIICYVKHVFGLPQQIRVCCVNNSKDGDPENRNLV